MSVFWGEAQVLQDVFIIGYDDAPDVEFSDPTLTTIRQPMQEAG
jgi:DNA-binding LacI/PurR family transcriptional regulator